MSIEITPDDLYDFQWRAAYRTPIARRARLNFHLCLFLTLLLVSVLPAISGDGFDISRVNFVFIAVGFPIVAFITWRLDRRLTRRAILELLKEEKPGRGQLGRHKVNLTGAGLVEATDVGVRPRAFTSLPESVRRPRPSNGMHPNQHVAHGRELAVP